MQCDPKLRRAVGILNFLRISSEMLLILATLAAGADAYDLRLTCANGKFIANKAYQGRKDFQTVYLEDCFETIGEYAFENTSVKSIRIPSTVKTIDSYAFQNTKLESINIPEGVTKIGSSCFANCPNLVNVQIPASVQDMKWLVFSCSNPEKIAISISKNNTYYEYRNGMIIAKIGGITQLNFVVDRFSHVTIPSDVTKIDQAGCGYLKKATTIDARSVQTLIAYAFQQTSNVVNITFGSGLKTIGASPFDGCSVLRNLFVEGENPVFQDFNGILYKKTQGDLELYFLPPGKGLTKFEIPKDMKTISAEPFKGTSVAEFTLESGNEYLSIHNGVVYTKSCDAVVACPPRLPANKFSWYAHPTTKMTTIKQAAFFGQVTFTSIEIPDGVVSIEKSAFRLASALTSIKLPESIESFGAMCFHMTSAVTSLVLPPKVTFLNDSMCAWMKKMGTVEIQGNVTEFDYGVFWHCETLKTINIPRSLQQIGGTAFGNCWLLPVTQLEFPEGLKYIGVEAFISCTGLIGNITIPSSVAVIDKKAFYMCSKIECVKIINCNTDIREMAFYSSDDSVIQTICIMTKVFTLDPGYFRQDVHTDILKLAGIITVGYLY